MRLRQRQLGGAPAARTTSSDARPLPPRDRASSALWSAAQGSARRNAGREGRCASAADGGVAHSMLARTAQREVMQQRTGLGGKET